MGTQSQGKHSRTFALVILLAFLNRPALAADYTEAISKAKEAALIQTGAANFISQFQSYSEKRAWHYAEQLNVDKEVVLGGALYSVYKSQSISIPLKNKELILKTDQIILKIGL